MSRHELPDGPIRPLKRHVEKDRRGMGLDRVFIDEVAPKAKRRVRCDACHQLFPAGTLYHGADPFAEEILGDSTPVRQCANCTAESELAI